MNDHSCLGPTTEQTPDILWKDGVLLVRRSQVIGEAEDRTKTKMMEILENHVKALPEELTSKSDLLSRSLTGGYQTASVLAKPIVAIAKAKEIQKHRSPYFMRRTFQDLCRAASVHDFVARSISGRCSTATAAWMEPRSKWSGESDLARGLPRGA